MLAKAAQTFIQTVSAGLSARAECQKQRRNQRLQLQRHVVHTMRASSALQKTMLSDKINQRIQRPCCAVLEKADQKKCWLAPFGPAYVRSHPSLVQSPFGLTSHERGMAMASSKLVPSQRSHELHAFANGQCRCRGVVAGWLAMRRRGA